uniref:Uncharacterized protein n=1 Tax=Mastacembelus armatus TaxID=205130 RepID=A0A3Q3RYR9_9TELE
MADVSLDEVIRQRGINLKLGLCFSLRPTFGRGAGGVGKSFDARQKIGVNDVRQRLGGGTDAREKLVQKDARFKIRGRGGAGAGGLQDARQMINSRKQGQNQPGAPAIYLSSVPTLKFTSCFSVLDSLVRWVQHSPCQPQSLRWLEMMLIQPHVLQSLWLPLGPAPTWLPPAPQLQPYSPCPGPCSKAHQKPAQRLQLLLR